MLRIAWGKELTFQRRNDVDWARETGSREGEI